MVNKGSNLEAIAEEVSSKQRTIHLKIDAAIDDGLKLVEHGRNVGITRQGAHYYLKQRGLLERWKQSRKALKLREIQEADEKLQGLAQIVNLLEKRMLQLAATKGWAYQKATEYLVLHKRSQLPLDSIAEFLQRYYNALIKGQRFNVLELGTGLDVNTTTLHNILTRSGVKPLNRSNNRKFIPEERKDIILRGANLPISYGDLAYYSKLPAYAVYYFVKKKELPRPKIKSNIVMIDDRVLTYRLASQIYEALDLELFNTGEVAELCNTSTEIVRYASKHKHQISKFIVISLRTLYPDKNIIKPYLES